MSSMMWDILVLVWLLIFLVTGVSRGLILTLGSVLVTLVAAGTGYWASITYSAQAADFLAEYLSAGELLRQAVANGLLFFGVYLIVRILGGSVLRLLDRVGKLPVLKQLNGLGGALAGLVRGCLLLLILGQLLVLAGLVPQDAALDSTILAKYFLTGIL